MGAMTEYVYYAKKIGEPAYAEQVVFVIDRPLTEDEQRKLNEALAKDGLEFVREWKYNGEAPDFAGTVNV